MEVRSNPTAIGVRWLTWLQSLYWTIRAWGDRSVEWNLHSCSMMNSAVCFIPYYLMNNENMTVEELSEDGVCGPFQVRLDGMATISITFHRNERCV